jgi:hypothetical protein
MDDSKQLSEYGIKGAETTPAGLFYMSPYDARAALSWHQAQIAQGVPSHVLDITKILGPTTVDTPIPHGYHVIVKTLTAHVYTVECQPNDTIAHVKQSIEQQNGLPVCQQRFVFAATQLSDTQTLASYGIQRRDVIILIIRLGGS